MDYDLISVAQAWPDIGGQTREPTLELRFMHGRLQQAWRTRDLGRNGETVAVRMEWHDVPDATPAPREEPGHGHSHGNHNVVE